MEQKLAVFPHRAKFIGFAMIILALPFAYLYFWGGKPEIFNIKTFALITTYGETRYFVLAQTNILDELATIFFISGLMFVSFSKQKVEKAYFEELRIKALIHALFFTLILWLISVFLFYGIAFLTVSILIFFVFLLSYNIFFHFYLHRNRE